MTKLLITGAAGFIGFHLTSRLAADSANKIVGLDNINDYYDPSLKRARLQELAIDTSNLSSLAVSTSRKHPNLSFAKMDLLDRESLFKLFAENSFDCVIHLAAQAGVRYSLQNPYTYIDSNVSGFLNLLEVCRAYPVKHLIFASSSSVYGLNKKVPFREADAVDYPASLYAATKKANELMAHSYSHLYGIPTTGLRFFTVYGPWGRPDMAAFLFAKKIYAGEPIDIFNYGDMRRDFTYVDDIVAGVAALIDHVPEPIDDPSSGSRARYDIFNIGNNRPVALLEFVETLESAIGLRAEKNLLPMQPGDVPETYADISKLQAAVGFAPRTSIDEGLRRFIDWYKVFYSK